MLHLNEAHDRALDYLRQYLQSKTRTWRILLVKDLFGRLRVILWCPKKDWPSSQLEIDRNLLAEASIYWSGDVLRGYKANDMPDGPWQNEAWQLGEEILCTSGLRILERQRTKEGWFEAPEQPPWAVAKEDPAIAVFYSFKGGVGRSTALAATALQLAAAGERVVVLDLDLDAPGVGALLAGHDGATARWGVVDYLIERRVLPVDEDMELADYYHRCPSSLFSGTGDIVVFSAGTTDRWYLGKLARLDYGLEPDDEKHPFVQLLHQIRRDIRPQWILVDARAGLGNVSGFLLGGLCHIHVLIGTLADASWQGLEMIIDRLGGDRVRLGRPQAECVLVAAMIPRSQERQFQESKSWFTDRARDVFTSSYYSEPDQGDEFWTVDDVESTDAPHVPVALSYDERLVLFREVSEVATDVLLEGEPYRDLVERLRASHDRLKEGSR